MISAAALYDARTRNIVSDKLAITSLVGGFRVLEVGAGTGRVIRWLIESNCPRIVGIDVDFSKIAVAREKETISGSEATELIHGDFLVYETDEKFERILFAFNVLAEFPSVEKRIQALRHAADMLSEDGRIVVITSAQDFDAFSKPEVTHRFEIPANDDLWDVQIRCERLQIAQVSHCEVTYVSKADGTTVCDTYETSLITRNECLACFSAAGLNLEMEFGSLNLNAVDETSSVLVHVLADN